MIDPVAGTDSVRDLAVADGVIVDAVSDAAVTLDVSGKVVAPGFVDVHVHLREPGQEHKEDVATATAAAAAGGFTTVVAMPNTVPPPDRPEHIAALRAIVSAKARVRVLTTAALSVDRAGKEATDIKALAAEPEVVAFTDDGNCLESPDLMRRVMTAAAATGLCVMDHCEDRMVWNNGVVRAGSVAEQLGVPGMPPETESNIVERNIALCRETSARIHMQHLSTTRSIELVLAARAEGLPVSAEITPHHLALTVDAVPMLGTNAKMNPPLGTEADRRVLIEAIVSGDIDVIATDHAPHAPNEKAQSLVDAPFGILGLETAWPVCQSILGERMSLAALIARFTVGPARLINREDLASLAVGTPADVVVLDPDCRHVLDLRKSKSKSRNSPFHGMSVRGKVCATIVGGRVIHNEL